MNFDEPRLSKINVRDPKSLYQLIVMELCGEKYFRPFEEKTTGQLQAFIEMGSVSGLNYEQFNELLLFLDQDRVSQAFFDFFCGMKKCLKLDELSELISRFRGFAMLGFGDFRFAYKRLCRHGADRLLRELDPYLRSSASILDELGKRPIAALKIEQVPKDKTWCLGYISKDLYKREIAKIKDALEKVPSDAGLLKQAKYYSELGDAILETEGKGLRNTDTYLTWDYMDVYIATSMRKRWEFLDTAEFVLQLFAKDNIRRLNLRYFDPTQSQCTSRIDKGLVEALMLKRAHCTVYMVQESDTMGKDSELASTLAQGKPVIAYVPRIDDIDSRARSLHQYPLEFFEIRFPALKAEGILDHPKLVPKLEGLASNFLGLIEDFLGSLVAYRKQQPLSLWTEKDDDFRAKTATFDLICRILATVEQFNFDKRAGTLRDTHPLSLQVHLESGVANGVLVVRTIADCADLLSKLLTNALGFTIEHDVEQGCTLLKEKISQSPFRAVTNYEKLANSFWNFYLLSKDYVEETKKCQI